MRLFGSSEDEAAAWVEALRGAHQMGDALTQDEHEAQQEKKVKGKAKLPTWVPDTDVVSCCGCQAKFGLFRRKHHCRRCGLVFCNSCAGRFCSCPDIGIPEKVRVCDNCFSVKIFRSQSLSQSQEPACLSPTTA